MDNDYKLKDQIVSSIFSNILVERNRNQSKIILKDFDENNPAHLLFLEISKICSDVYDTYIYIDSSFIDYWKLYFKNKKYRKKIKRIKGINNFKVVSIDTILTYVIKSFNVKYEYLYEIYQSYYERKDK